MIKDAQSVLSFWFNELTPAQWFKKDTSMDQQIAQRFGPLLSKAAACECYEWRSIAQGRLAEIIVLDQFSRNIYRDDPRAFANDALALALAQEAVALAVDNALSPVERSFLYMPYMHSESAAIHEVAMQLFDQPGLENNLDFEIRHKAIIDRFGRYPHRNEVLGRASTSEENEFLKQPGSAF
ncbi:DUF924 family protein [Vreelandella alkaliphila]|uniref:DUF924 domain-containing protein n=1 Tax=Vreelandella alkaliphila TaxID=272774 RepID=A0A7C9K4Z7_9GAMM|nr:DUF924 family protein [Halomonas alkaliphila]NDL69721.1 DUF924 domain-containing protein [Halomonas alkaliphila]